MNKMKIKEEETSKTANGKYENVKIAYSRFIIRTVQGVTYNVWTKGKTWLNLIFQLSSNMIHFACTLTKEKCVLNEYLQLKAALKTLILLTYFSLLVMKLASWAFHKCNLDMDLHKSSPPV